jgi:hypothetical protein
MAKLLQLLVLLLSTVMAAAFLPRGFSRALQGAASSTALGGKGDARTKRGKIFRGSNG